VIDEREFGIPDVRPADGDREWDERGNDMIGCRIFGSTRRAQTHVDDRFFIGDTNGRPTWHRLCD
jgi:hypothetical protein